MKWSKKIILACIALGATISLTACGKNQEDASGKVEIEFFNQKKEMTQTIQEIAKDFEAKNPDIHVKVVDVPNAGEVIKTRMLAGDVPDVINLYPQSIELKEWAKYNKTAFEEMGIQAPETWAEFEKIVAEIKDQNKVPFAIAGAEGWTLNGYHQLAIATAAGGEEEANNVWRFSEVNGINAESKEMQKDFNRLDLLREPKALQNNWQGAGYNDTVVTFTKGDALIMPNGSWAMPMIHSQNPDFEVGTFPFPADEAGQSLTIGAGDLALSVSATSQHKEEAKRFVEYMTTPEAMQKYYDVDGAPCAVEGVIENTQDSPLSGLTELAFTDRHLVWLAKDWNSENDFYTLTTNYLHNGNQKAMINALNAFFNPMKADGR